MKKIVREILGRVFALWAAIIFVLSLLVVFLPIYFTKRFPEPKRTVRVFKTFRGWMKFWFTLSGVRRIFTGQDAFKEGRNYVVVCNHNSFMDVPLSSPGIPGANKTIAKSEMARIPLFGMIYKRGSVLVNRKSEESRRQSYQRMRDILNMGLHMCIYPEGTRNKGKELLQRFHDGAFKLAVETGKEVIPAVIFHSAEILPRKPFFFWPRPIEMHFLPPIPSQGKTVQALKEEVFSAMLQRLQQGPVTR